MTKFTLILDLSLDHITQTLMELIEDNGKLKFTRKAEDPEAERTFVKFILNPLYKIYSHVLSEDADDLKETLRSLGITLKSVLYKMDTRPLLKVVLDQFFGPATGLVDVIVNHIPSPVENNADKVSTVSHSSFSTH